MSDSSKVFQQIEDYLSDSLDKEERASFEATLAQDSDLQHRVEMMRLTNLAMIRHKFYQLKDIAQNIDKQEKKKATTKKILAGSLAFVLVSASITYVALSNKEEAQLSNVDPVPAASSSIEKEKNNTPVVKADPIVQEQTQKSPISERPMEITPITNSSISPSEEKVPLKEEKQEVPSNTVKEAPILMSMPQAKPEEEDRTMTSHCAKTILVGNISVETACINQHNGRIDATGIKGGKAPYHYQVYDDAQHPVAATQLSKGYYSVVMLDADNCSTRVYNIEIKEENCQKDFELNANNGETLDLGIMEQPATLSVVDKSGVLHFHKQYTKGEQVSWDGVSTKGEAQVGYFIFVLQYTDGTVRRGSVTVIR